MPRIGKPMDTLAVRSSHSAGSWSNNADCCMIAPAPRLVTCRFATMLSFLLLRGYLFFSFFYSGGNLFGLGLGVGRAAGVKKGSRLSPQARKRPPLVLSGRPAGAG